MKSRTKLYLHLAQLCLLIQLTGCQTKDSHDAPAPPVEFVIIAPYTEQTAFKLFSDGSWDKIELSAHDFYRAESGVGNQKPKASPDKSLIAYIDDYNLWFYDTQSKSRERVTTVGMPADRIYAAIDILLSGWSRDGKLFLYALKPGYNPVGALKIRKLEKGYGFYVYKVETQEHTRVELPERVYGWLNNEEVLIVSDRGNKRLKAFAPLENKHRTLSAPAGWYIQPSLSRDGQFLVAVSLHLHQFIKLNLRTGEFHYIRKGQHMQWPKLSPNDRRVAYIQKIPSRSRSQAPAKNVMVDDRLIFEYKGNWSIRVKWIDNETVAIPLENEILIADISTKVIKTKIPVQ